MASTNRIFVSPGVFTSEQDLTFVTRQVGVTTLGVVGETPKGPAFEPVFISNYDDFMSYYGGLNTTKYTGTGLHKYELNYIAKSFLTQTNQLYVNRVLGLSGYKAGDAWAITMNAAQDDSTTGVTSTTSYPVLLDYSATTAGPPVTMTFNDPILQDLYDDGTISGLFTTIGTLPSGTTITQSTPAFVSVPGTDCSLSASTWEMEITAVSGTPLTDAGFVSGRTSGTVITYSASCFSDIDDAVVATLRSRGGYQGDQILDFTVATASMANTTGIETNPFGQFTISGTTTAGGTFSYDVSLDKTKQNYIESIFGRTTQDKDTELFVEEIYYNSLEDLNSAGKVLGLADHFNDILTGTTNNLEDYQEQWKSAASPYVLSELKGDNLERLFRFITISDGNSANRDIKISIINIKPDNKTFDLLIRKFSDTDANPTVFEKYSKLSMDPKEKNYIGRRIGTSNGDFPLKSKYVMVQMAEFAPKDSFPAGFAGVENRNYIGTRTSLPPQIEYATSYPSLSNNKVRKYYLGLNSNIGVDTDFFTYKGLNAVTGLEFTGKTDGFHMDVNAEGAEIVGPDAYFPVLQVGVSAFTSEASTTGGPYEKLNTRKFTFAPYGGYDGWDEYREERTNTDAYTYNGSKGIDGLNLGVFTTRDTSQGDDGITSDYYAYLDAIYNFDNPEAININVFATPGIDLDQQNGLVEQAVDMVEVDRADSLYIITTSDTDSDGVAITPDEAVDLVDNSDIDSNYSCTYWPWLQMNDTENNEYVWLPPTLEVVRNIALTDNVAFPWFAAAGLNRGTTNAIRARVKLTLDQRDTLYEGRINPLATFSDVGVVIWGNKTLQEKETALNRINVRRLLLQARKLISAVAIRLLFEQNDEVVRNQFLSLVNPILDNIRKERGLTDFRVVLDDTPESIDRNELNGKIFIKPTRTLEYISIEFNIMNTGASFDDI